MPLRIYLGAVYLAGAAAAGWMLATASWVVHGELQAVLAVAAVLLVLGELFPMRLWSRGNPQEYTMSGAFALVLLNTGPLVYALLPAIAALLVVEVRERKPLRVAAFNVAQNILMLGAARLAICAIERVGVSDPITGVPAGQQLIGLAGGAVAYFLVNNILTGTAFALSSGSGVPRSILSSMREEFPVTPIVLGVSPMIAASLAFSIWTAPLCVLVIVAIRTAVMIATRHEIAALHDSLTGLPNRTLLLMRLRESMADATPERQTAALMIDLDRFKEINDTLGHSVGDELLKVVAQRLTEITGSRGTVARLGGDEFAIVLNRTTAATTDRLAGEAAAAFVEPIRIADMSLTVTASVGAALSPQHAVDAEKLLHLADLALYAAKQERGRHAFYDPESEEHSTASSVLVGELQRGLGKGELVVFYQPKVDALTGALIGVEALVRWQHPTRGLLPPGRFLPAVENTPLVVPLTAHVIDSALAAVRGWRDRGLAISVAINLTARQVASEDLPRQIEAALALHGLPSQALVVEVTESSLMANPAQTRTVLGRLREMGVGLSMDDFGTGYSSFTHLRDLPVTEIKIDQSFVAGTVDSVRSAALVKSIIDLAHNLGLNVVAEGVETTECRSVLTGMGCTMLQGYLLARPMPADQLEQWYAAQLALTAEPAVA
ncbi:putative bifunctional diguanylate cyclase/phosphodiesterase [Paractinoplanes rishiriensis]|uniref:GGDEF-domain containing protein n=1 Tax=Paractinoplanes rishiriensis TaxID=1050105 RepID=A0A919MTN9_9ACTN|nr:EAL domain-containing protein [Actinoplanes rishiriensis]GIE94464.1 GGDEF-domain containing protein [Actinoplanes rishiriensis]